MKIYYFNIYNFIVNKMRFCFTRWLHHLHREDLVTWAATKYSRLYRRYIRKKARSQKVTTKKGVL